MNLNWVKKITISTLAGGAIGCFIMYPAFMIIDDYLMHNDFDFLENYLSYFGINQLHKIIFFVLVGAVFGFLYGLYNHRKKSFIEKLRQISNTDELTQIYNRRYFINELEREIERSKRFSRHMSLVILDLDKFKYNNDTHGHIFGDQILQSTAKILTGITRKFDFVARYGGDEFVIVMPETEKSMAIVFAERLRKELYQYSFKNHKLPVKNTVSIGVASFPVDAKNIDELIHNADIALYNAKEEGRNRVCSFNIKLKRKSNQVLDFN